MRTFIKRSDVAIFSVVIPMLTATLSTQFRRGLCLQRTIVLDSSVQTRAYPFILYKMTLPCHSGSFLALCSAKNTFNFALFSSKIQTRSGSPNNQGNVYI